MMKWTDSPPYRLSSNNGRSYVGFCQKNSLGQSTAERQVAGHRGGERTTRPMSGVRTAPLCLEQLLLDLALIVGKAQKIDCLFEVASGDDEIARAHLVQLAGSGSHLLFAADGQACYRSGFVHVRRDHGAKRKEALDHHSCSRRIDQRRS